MAIEDMSSLAWMEYRQRRLREQNRGGAEDQAPPDNMTADSPSTSSQRRGVKRKQNEASSPERPSSSSATSSSRRDADSESIELADNRDDRSEESQTSGSLAEFRDDASTPQQNAMFYASLDQERATALDDTHVPQSREGASEDGVRQLDDGAPGDALAQPNADRGEYSVDMIRQVVSEAGMQQLDEGAPSEVLANLDADFDEDNVDKPSDPIRSGGETSDSDVRSSDSSEGHSDESASSKDAEDERVMAQGERHHTESREGVGQLEPVEKPSSSGERRCDEGVSDEEIAEADAEWSGDDLDLGQDCLIEDLTQEMVKTSVRDPEPVPVTTVYEEWKRLVRGGYAVGTGLLTTILKDGRETKCPQPGRWKHLTRREASFCDQEDNMLYMTTGRVNDVIVFDVDLGDGMTAYRELLESAGIPFGSLDHTLTQSGGRHAFFSYEKSVQAGLEVASWKANQMGNRVKMVLNGRSVSMDLRGDGGLIILPPTWVTFRKTTGETRRYEALQQLPRKGELPAMPPVLIDVLNSQTPAQPEGGGRVGRSVGRVGGDRGETSAARVDAVRPIQGAEGDLSASVVARLDALLARSRGRSTLVYYKRERMESGEWRFQYAPRGAWVCGHDEAHRGSNGVSFFYDPQTDRFTERCHGGECDRRPRTVLQEDPAVAGIITGNCGIGPVGGSDQSIYKRVPLTLAAEFLRLSADGGSRLFRALYAGDPRIKWVAGSSSGSGAGFYFWNGRVFEKDIPEAQGGMVHNLIADQLTQATEQAYREVGKEAEQQGDEAEAKRLGFLLPKKRPRWNGPGGPGGVIKYARFRFYDPTFMKDLDYVSKWFLPAKNGVIDLRDGTLHPHHPRYLFSNTIAVEYPGAGLEHPTLLVDSIMADAWMLDEHPERAEVVAYLQRVLGYLLTGDVDERLLVYICGPTASGKGLLMEAIRDLMGSFFLQGNKSIIFKAAGQGDISRGGANTDLAATKKKRLVLFDESGEVDRLDDAGVKYMTGGADINARDLYERGVDATFKPTAKFVVTSNRPPLLDFNDAAMEDRLIYFSLERSFVKAENYVEGNPRIRPRDLKLKDRMKTPEAQQELLIWLVKGQVNNARNGGIGMQPEFLKQAKRELYASNDTLGVFISTECEVGWNFIVQATSMLAAYNAYLAQEQKGRCKPSALTKFLKEKKFEKEERVRHPAMVNQFPAYRGLRVKRESTYWEIVQGVFLYTDEERRALR